MSPQDFLAHFHEIANAPGGVARLRELILAMAVQGELVAATESREVFLDEVVELISGQHLLANEQNSQGKGIPYLTGPSDFGPKYPTASRWTETPKVVAEPGDILLTVKGAGVGKTNRVLDETTAISRQLMAVRAKSADPDFVELVLMNAAAHFQSAMTGIAIPGIGRRDVLSLKTKLPPLAEQKRIVAKVEELMALCDALEAQQQERARLLPRLSRATHTRLTDSPTQPHLDSLFADLASISPEDMRRTIINFAVQGWLVKQDTNDEPASEALQRIRQARLNAGEKDFGTVPDDDVPFELPSEWRWIKMGNLALSSDSGWSPQCESIPRKGTEWGVLKVSAVSWDTFDPEENKALPVGMAPRPECEVRDGDFLLSRANTEELVARSVVVTSTPPHLMMSDKIVRLVFPEEVEKQFINLANSTTFARAHYAKHASGTSSSMKNVGRGTMCNLPIPFPPLAEQRRIAAKVDELMALVDTLEAQQQEKSRLAEAFAQARASSLAAK